MQFFFFFLRNANFRWDRIINHTSVLVLPFRLMEFTNKHRGRGSDSVGPQQKYKHGLFFFFKNKAQIKQSGALHVTAYSKLLPIHAGGGRNLSPCLETDETDSKVILGGSHLRYGFTFFRFTTAELQLNSALPEDFADIFQGLAFKPCLD